MFYRAVVTTDSGDVVVATWTGDDAIRLYSGADDGGVAKEVISLLDPDTEEFFPPRNAKELTSRVLEFMANYDPEVSFDSAVVEVLHSASDIQNNNLL